MRTYLFFNLLWSLSLLSSPAIGQTVWNNLPLTGANAKIIPAAAPSRFHLSFTGAFLLGGVSPQNIDVAKFQNAAVSPGTFEQLFEKLGGEFFMGSPSGQPGPAIELSGQTQMMPGLRVGLRLGKRFEICAGSQYFQSKWSGEFPVLVFPHFNQEQPQPKTLQGHANASVSGILANIETAFFLTNGAVQPYLKAGIRGQFSMQHEQGADIAGVSLPIEAAPTKTRFSPFGSAGVRGCFLKNVFAEAGFSFGELPNGDYQPALELGIGLRL